MPPTIEVGIAKELGARMSLTLRNLAVLLQADLRVVAEDAPSSSVSFSTGERRIELPAPDLDAWRKGNIQTRLWHTVPLPQPSSPSAEHPDLLGLAHCLFHDKAERWQEEVRPNQRYDINRSPYASAYGTNYLDRALRRAFAQLGLSGRRPCGVILTHDLDVLSRRGLRSYPWSARMALVRVLDGLRHGRLRQVFSYLLSFFELVRSDPGHAPGRFEFLDWAEAEARLGYRSVFFVFAPDRERSCRDDACYAFSDRNSGHPRITLRAALKNLISQGFVVGPHLSRSSGYDRKEIDREFDSLARGLNIPVVATRNHWLWIRYSDWYQILLEKQVESDFNQVTFGYPKGTSFPYLSTNQHTLIFPTTYVDDAVLNKDRLHLPEDRALELLAHQLDSLHKFGGCIALSFHPADDAPPGTRKVHNKLAFYRRILAELSRRGVPVYLPSQARQVFLRSVEFEGFPSAETGCEGLH
jgi:hypothetical protein